MAGEPSTQNTLDRINRDMAQQEAMSLPRKRLTSNRISLTKPKKAYPDKRNMNPSPLRGAAVDPIQLIDDSFEAIAPPRRRTVQLNEIMAPQDTKENIINSNNLVGNDGNNNNNRNEFYRKRLATNNDSFTFSKQPKLHTLTGMNGNDDLHAVSSWDERQYKEQLRETQELLQLYKDQLIEKTLQYEELLHARTTKQEEALENFAEWRQPTEEGYLALRDQVEEFLSRDKNVESIPTNQHHHQQQRYHQQENTAELKALITQLQTELEQKNTALKEQAKMAMDEPRLLLDLYEDLTGLIVREMKKGDGTTAYKCVVAGKNGTFQFALSIGRGKNAYVFYSPSLDRQRDSRLLSTFPSFMKEDIEFDRDNLPSFFSRLSQLLN